MTTPPRPLAAAELAHEAGVPIDEVEELAAAALLRADRDGHYSATDVYRLRLVRSLRDGGITVDDIGWASQTNQLPLDRVAEMFAPPSRSDHTFEELEKAVGERGGDLGAIYAAFGLAVPPPGSPIPADEEEIVHRFLDVWAMVDDTPEVALRAAHIAGDGVRRMAGATLDLFDAHGGTPPDRLRRGMSQDDAMRPSIVLSVLQTDLLAWLENRHTEHEVFERIVDYMERAVAQAGRAEPRLADPPAIAFVDLAGYTELTASDGDERAADFATDLHVIASRVVSSHGGRVVKQLGDGVLLRFGSAIGAIEGVRELMAAIALEDLPPAHAAVAVGRFVVREGDVYGNTVNVAARLAAHAGPGELLIRAEDARAWVEPSGWTDAGEASFKGIADPISVARLHVPMTG
ncbi:MAG: MerR family transcriptional regulator [Chloroflexota bacterium]